MVLHSRKQSNSTVQVREKAGFTLSTGRLTVGNMKAKTAAADRTRQ